MMIFPLFHLLLFAAMWQHDRCAPPAAAEVCSPVMSGVALDTGGRRWAEMTSVRDVLAAYPVRMRALLDALDLTRPSLQSVRTSLANGDTVAACRKLLEYYRTSPPPTWLRGDPHEPDPGEILATARKLRDDTVTFAGVTARVPRRADGGWTWTFTGPGDDQEFGYSLNGHQYLLSLLQAWQTTGKKSYVETFDRLIRDWIIHNPFPLPGDSIFLVLKSKDNKPDWRDIGEVRWRTLETGNRLGVSWPRTFYGFQQTAAFAPATRLLMLSGLLEQAHYIRTYHKRGHNWTTMEMNGLALTGLTFPEFKDAEAWTTYAMSVMKEEINRQVYPDGVQTELSTKTQWVALRRFESVADYFTMAGRNIPQSYMRRIEEMYNYLAYSMRPDGHQPLNNDSDREDLRSRVLRAAHTYKRPDWRWIATNGREGVEPEGLPSIVFPWAGIHVMRSGWDAGSHWAFFDTGPFGTGHQHADRLHLSVAAFGRDLLVDGGRYTHENYWSFDPRVWRGYFRSAFSHNVIIVDGKGQKGGPVRADHAAREGADYLSTQRFDYARGFHADGYNDLAGSAAHARAVLYVRNKFWIVVDRIVTDQPRRIQALWHYSPESVVHIEKGTVVSANQDAGNLRIVPAGETVWKAELVKGQTDPVIQGWYSPAYGQKIANATAVFTADIDKSVTFAWVLVPAMGKVPGVRAEIRGEEPDGVRVLVKLAGDEIINVTVPLEHGTPRVE